MRTRMIITWTQCRRMRIQITLIQCPAIDILITLRHHKVWDLTLSRTKTKKCLLAQKEINRRKRKLGVLLNIWIFQNTGEIFPRMSLLKIIWNHMHKLYHHHCGQTKYVSKWKCQYACLYQKEVIKIEMALLFKLIFCF